MAASARGLDLAVLTDHTTSARSGYSRTNLDMLSGASWIWRSHHRRRPGQAGRRVKDSPRAASTRLRLADRSSLGLRSISVPAGEIADRIQGIDAKTSRKMFGG